MMTATRRRYAARAALSIMLAAAAGPAPGADPGSGASSHAAPADIVVAATRTARDVQGIPQAVFRLDAARRLQERGDRTLPDLLEGAPSVMVQKTGYAQASPYLRGFTGFRTLFLIDGVPLNNSTFRDGPNQYWNTVDPYACETVELLLGPSSVLYGTDAIGGAVRTVPAAPPPYEGAPAWRRRVVYRAASAENSHTLRLEAAGRPTAAFGYTAGVTLKAFGDLRSGRHAGVQEHTGYGEQAADLRADYYLNADETLTLAWQTVDQDDAWRTHKTVYGLAWNGTVPGDEKQRSLDQDRDLAYVRWRRAAASLLGDETELTLWRHAQGESQYRVKKDDTSDRQRADVTTWGVTAQARRLGPWGEWVYGLDAAVDSVDTSLRKFRADGSLKTVGIQGPVADDAAYRTLGVFLQNTARPLGGALEVTPGLRYARYAADAGRVEDVASGAAFSLREDWETVVGSLRALLPLSPDRRHVLYAGLAQGFRAPNLSDLTRLDSARSNEIETPSPGLRPERTLSAEAGLKSRLDRLVLEADLYHTWIDGMIVRTPTGRMIDALYEVTKKNAGDGGVSGASLTARYRLSSCWTAWVTGSVMDGRVAGYPTSDDRRATEPLSRLMPPTLNTGVRWRARDGGRWAELAVAAAARADRLSADDRRDAQRIPPGGTPGYGVAHLRTGFRLTPALSVHVALENILDKDYRIHGSGVNEPGRNLVLSAAATF